MVVPIIGPLIGRVNKIFQGRTDQVKSFIIGLAVLVAILFFIEFFVEITLGIFASIINYALNTFLGIPADIPTRWDWPLGPLSFISWAVGIFPSFWDIGSVLLWGSWEETTYILFMVFALMADLLGGFFIFANLRNAFKSMSDQAGAKADDYRERLNK